MRNFFLGILILSAVAGYTRDYKLTYDVYFPFPVPCVTTPHLPFFDFRLSFNTFNNDTIRTIASGTGLEILIKGVLSIPANEGPIKTIWLDSKLRLPFSPPFPRIDVNRVVYQNPGTLLDVHNTFDLAKRAISWGCLNRCRDSPIVIRAPLKNHFLHFS